MRNPLVYWQRYVGALWRYGTPRKLSNLARAYYHHWRGSAHIPTMPAFLKVEISRTCHVKCRLCPGIVDDQFYPLGRDDDVFYPLEKYKELVDRLKKYVFLVSLYDIGEPLENPDVLDYVRYARDKRMGTSISSSLSMRRSDEFWRDLAGSGLSRMIVAFDGTTPEVHRQYRTNADLDLAMSNLRQIVAHKKSLGKGPVIEWQMLDLPSNRHQQADARAMAAEMGCDQFRLIREVTILRSRYEQEGLIRDRNCLLPYVVFIVNAHNDVRPCCNLYTRPMVVGTLNENSFEDIWNGEEMARIRDVSQIEHRPGCMTCQQ